MSEFGDVANLTFPDDEDFPAELSKFFKMAFVAFNISGAFILPKFFVGFGDNFAIRTFVHMPETAMNKDYFFVFDKHNIRVTG